MAKYTDEENIAYLRTLREGDVLTAVADSDEYYTEGKQYVVEKDDDGDLYVMNNFVNSDYVNVGDDYNHEFSYFIREGIFEIPTPTPDSFYVQLRQVVGLDSEGAATKSVTIHVDDAGFAELEALERRSFKSRELAGLYAQRAEIQAEIVAAERSREAG